MNLQNSKRRLGHFLTLPPQPNKHIILCKLCVGLVGPNKALNQFYSCFWAKQGRKPWMENLFSVGGGTENQSWFPNLPHATQRWQALPLLNMQNLQCNFLCYFVDSFEISAWNQQVAEPLYSEAVYIPSITRCCSKRNDWCVSLGHLGECWTAKKTGNQSEF